MFLKQSTTITIRMGPALDKTDGVTEETGLSPTVEISKNNGAFAARNSATAIAHDSNGWYSVELNTTDTNTVGRLISKFDDAATHLPVWHDMWVLEEDIYEALFAASAAAFNSSDQVAVGSIAANAITATSIASFAFTAVKIGTDAITSDKIAANAIGASEIADGAIDAATFAAGAIDASAIADNAIDAGAIASFAITAIKIGTDAITSDKIAANAIGASEIADGAIDAGAIASFAITAVKIGTDAITAAKIAADAIGASEIATGAIDADAIAADAITSAKIADFAILAINLGTDSITAAKIATDAITEIQSGLSTVTTAQVNTEVDAALADVNLDHLVGTASGIPAIPAGTYVDQMMDDGTAVYDRTTDSLQAIADAGGGGPTAAQIADAVWDEAKSGHTVGTSFGDLAVDLDAVLADTNELQVDDYPARFVTVDNYVQAILADTGTAGVVLANFALTAGKIGTDAITAAKIAADAIGASELAADAVTEIQSGLAIQTSVDDLEGRLSATRAGYLDNLSAGAVALETTAQSILTDTADMQPKLGTPVTSVSADIAAIEAQTDDIGTAGAGLTAVPWNASWDTEVESEALDALNTILADSIPADGTIPTLRQALYMLTQFMMERSVSGTTVTVKKVNGSTTLLTLTLDSATDPTSITRAT